MCAQTHMQRDMCTNTQMHAYTQARTYMHRCMHICIYTQMHAYTHRCVYKHIRRCVHTHTDVCIHIQMCAHKHILRCVYTHMHAHTPSGYLSLYHLTYNQSINPALHIVFITRFRRMASCHVYIYIYSASCNLPW